MTTLNWRRTVSTLLGRANGMRSIICCAISIAIAFASVSARAEQMLDLTAYRGKVVVVDFWASWCTPCRQSFPWLNAIHERYADRGLVVLGVNVDRDRAQADGFLREVPAQFPILYDSSGTLATRYKLMGMPTSLVFGPDGELIRTHIGFKKAARAEREAELVALLQQHQLSLQR
jgi:thiol-disulfide isomerase/thioredoxin